MELKHEIFKLFPNKWFVETGSYAGDGVQAALESGFENIISLEVGVYNYNLCKERFNGVSNVSILNADSAIMLWDVIKGIDAPITFFLDGHWSGEGSPIGIVNVPLLYELAQIRQHPIKTHTILIDDVRCWRGVSPIRDFQLEDVIFSLKAINPDYTISYMDGTEPNDVLIAKV